MIAHEIARVPRVQVGLVIRAGIRKDRCNPGLEEWLHSICFGELVIFLNFKNPMVPKNTGGDIPKAEMPLSFVVRICRLVK